MARESQIFHSKYELSTNQSGQLATFAELLEQGADTAECFLDLPIEFEFLYRLRTPFSFRSTAEIGAERARVLVGIDHCINSDLDPHWALCAAARAPISMAWLYHGNPDHELRRPYGALLESLLRKAAPQLLEPLSGRKPGMPRIGFISPQMRNANASRWALAYAEAIKGDAELFSINIGPTEDDMSLRWATVCAHHIHWQGDRLQIGASIKQLDLDLLIFTDVGIDGITDVIGSMRLARRQAVLWGAPCSTGLTHMDDFLIGEDMLGESSEFSERVVPLPGAGIYFERSLIQDFPAEIPPSETLFCCQNLPKLHPKWDPLLAEVVKMSGNPIALTKHDSRAITKKTYQRLAEFGVQVQFMDFVPEPYFPSVLRSIRGVLDTPSFNGGVTHLFALAAGCPLLTLPQNRFRDRFGYAFLKQLGLEKWCANSPEEYVERLPHMGQMKHELAKSQPADLLEDRRVLQSFRQYCLN